ncbi:stage II sporulation protein R [Clostridium sediminicola]|uniref:stage II sporulation protein R n=1 Tax=Clostridium sediminicola TaxID=3114879 RepID=UPI0031F1F413
MKKLLVFFLLVAIMMGSFTYINKHGEKSQESIADKLIRFHVIANSDTTSDQAVKLKVRDEVLNYIAPKLKNSKSIEESREILKDNTKEIENISKLVINENGYNYDIKVSLSEENFPVKSYGNITLPQGKYEAYRIIIGSGKGHNWWCVMFPPLCFTDVTRGEVAYKEMETNMKSVLTNEEYALINNSANKSGEEEDASNIDTSKINGKKVVFKFKVFDFIDNVKNKVGGFFKSIFNDNNE